MTTGGRRYAVVSGGGTAGHVVPMLAVARALCRRGLERSSIELLGSERGQEAAMFADSGFPFTLLPGRGLHRGHSLSDLVDNTGSLAAATRASVAAVAMLRAWRPAVVVTVGGYASFPAGVAAAILRIPLVMVNIDAVPGLVHRVLAPLSSASAVAFPGTALPRAVVTGTPLREEMSTVSRSPRAQRQARQALGIPPDRDVIVAFGGSLGARRINEAVAGLVELWHDRKDLALYQVVGERNWDQAPRTSPEADLWHRVVAFEQRMPLLYAAADVMVCRAGAMTVGELALAGVPAVLVPLPEAPGDHQTANAKRLADVGAAVLLPDSECAAAALERLLERVLSDPHRRERMAAMARRLGMPGAADRVAEVVASHAR